MTKIVRRLSKTIRIGKVSIGAKFPIAIQSMAKTRTSDIESTTRQIKVLEGEGCEIVRVAVKTSADAQAIAKIKKKISLPLVADIHFDWRLGIEAIEHGADKIRLNPSNIDRKKQIREIAACAALARIPIRIGLNSGSLGNSRRQAERMVESARHYIRIFEGFKFYDLVVSLKASDILSTVEAYRKMARVCDYPLHLGLTATGFAEDGVIKSSIALGTLLLEGIGDTVRVSLTARPEKEVKVAKCILQSLGLRHFGPQIISCPTCGRCQVDLVRLVKELEKKLQARSPRLQAKDLKVAVMGCEVNGPGEARDADIGIAFGKKEGLLFKNGKAAKKVSFDECAEVLIKEMDIYRENLAKQE